MLDWRHMAVRDEYRARGLDLDLETPLRSFDRPFLQIGLADDGFAPPRAQKRSPPSWPPPPHSPGA